ncbi:uncharacterized protein TNCV_1636541 [Trichonephila clavipes]|nr:uncharacterized protein TNCV_1636541 [Trichonephila clavipes]
MTPELELPLQTTTPSSCGSHSRFNVHQRLYMVGLQGHKVSGVAAAYNTCYCTSTLLNSIFLLKNRKMSSHRETTESERLLVVKWSKEGKSLREIASLIGVTHGCVQKILQKYKKTGSVANIPGR